jgi:hypothetical protein
MSASPEPCRSWRSSSPGSGTADAGLRRQQPRVFLDALADNEGLSRQEAIRRAVLERYERAGHRARVDASAERLVDRWSDVLDRLGSV